jgi:formamidopyrimidine-DNA glycosylase
MPELPEVQTVAATLRARILGARIECVDVRRPDIVSPAGLDLVSQLTGRTLRDITRRGKRIIFCLDDGNRFYVHLGMTGRLTAERCDAPVPRHTHLILTCRPPNVAPPGAFCHVRFTDPRRFGGLWWIGNQGTCDDGIGPEPLVLQSSQLAKRLLRTHRPIKVALLDQALIAGLGNIYVDESLFAAGVHPLVPADQLTGAQVAQLSRAIKRVLRKAIHHRGSTLRDYRDADGRSGSFQDLHRVYQRQSQPCPRCRSTIQRIVLGGRSTHFCPTCQPAANRRIR